MAQLSKLNQRFAGNKGFEEARARAHTYIRIGSELRHMREENGLTQGALAAQAGLDQSDISKIEAGIWGRRGISLDTLKKVLPIFGLRIVHTVEPESGAALNSIEQAHVQAINDLMQADA